MHMFHIFEKLQLYNKHLMIKMLPNTKKTSNIWSFLFFKTAKQFARNLHASHYHTNICKETMRMWTNLPCFTGLSLFSFHLSIRNVKHGKWFISSSCKRYIIHYEVPLEYRREYSWKPCTVKKIGHKLRYYRMPSECTMNWENGKCLLASGRRLGEDR